MAITFRKVHERHTGPVEAEALPALDSSFDQDELVAVADYLARSVTEGLAEWDDCARELSAWADANSEALALAAESSATDRAAPEASSLLRDAATRRTGG